MFSLSDLTTPLTRDQVKASIYNVLNIVGVDTTSWKPGAAVRTMITGSSVVMAAFSTLQAKIASSGFLELATDEWLTLVARYVFNEERLEATQATGIVTLTNAGGLTFVLDPGDVVLLNPDTDKTYTNDDAINLGPGDVLDIAITSEEFGAATSSTPNTIVQLVTTLLGVTVTNAASVVGQDAEEDPILRIRCKEKLGSLSPNGPWDAYSFVARKATRLDGTTIGVTRVRVTKDGFGHVEVYCATATGGVTGTSGDPNTDLGAIHDAIQHQAAPLSITENTHSAVAIVLPVTYTATMYNTSGLSEQQIKDAIASALTAYFPLQPIGGNVVGGVGYIFQDAVRTVIGASLSQIFHVVVTLPAGDTVLGISDVATLGTVTGTIVQVAPPDGGL